MSRPKQFPETIYVGMNKVGDCYVIPDKEATEFIMLRGISKIMSYTINGAFKCKKDGKPRKALRPVSTPATAPKEPDNQASEATDANLPIVEADSKVETPKKRHHRTKAASLIKDSLSALATIYKPENPADRLNWKCTACGRFCDTPYKIVKGQFKGMLQCPFCHQYTMVKNEVAE